VLPGIEDSDNHSLAILIHDFTLKQIPCAVKKGDVITCPEPEDTLDVMGL
jgi:hypothetical protein